MTNLTERFVNKLYLLNKTDIPESVMVKAQECFLDYLSVTIGACRVYYQRNKNYLTENHITGDCHIIGVQSTVDARNACLINAFNAHVLELDDSHRVAMTHLGAPIFSALLCVAELNNKTINDVLRAAVIGYEAAIRLANAIQPGHKRRGFHVSGTCCTVGSAMAIASLLDYSFDDYMNAFSAAASSAAGLLAISSGRSEQKPYNIANAAVSGFDAAIYGRIFIGSDDILGDSRGFLSALSDNARSEYLFEDGYAIEGIYQKLYAACRHCHAPMEASLQLVDNNTIDIDLIKEIIVYTYDMAIKGHDHTDIPGVSSAKQSIPYGVAVACVYKDCGQNAFSKEKIKDIKLLDLVKKVRIVEDTSLSDQVPAKRAARVEISLQNGKTLSRQVDFAKGEPENPITTAEFKEKFESLCYYSGIHNEYVEIIYKAVNNREYRINDLLQLINDYL